MKTIGLQRSDYISIVKALGQDIIDYAEEIIDEQFNGSVTVSFTIYHSMEEMPMINIDKDMYSKGVIDAIKRTYEVNE